MAQPVRNEVSSPAVATLSSESRGRLRTCCSALRPIVLLLDGEGTVLRISPSLRERLLLGDVPVLGARHGALLGVFEAEMVGKAVQAAKGAGNAGCELFWLTPGTSHRSSTAWSALSIPPEDGAPELIVITGVEDDPRLAGLGDARSLLVMSRLPMWVVDRRTFRFRAANPAAAAQLGHSQKELLSTRLVDVLFPDDVLDALETLMDLTPGEGTFACWRFRREDGSLTAVELQAMPAEAGGAPLCMVLSWGAERVA